MRNQQRGREGRKRGGRETEKETNGQRQLSSIQSLDRFDRREDVRDDSAEVLFQSFSSAG